MANNNKYSNSNLKKALKNIQYRLSKDKKSFTLKNDAEWCICSGIVINGLVTNLSCAGNYEVLKLLMYLNGKGSKETKQLPELRDILKRTILWGLKNLPMSGSDTVFKLSSVVFTWSINENSQLTPSEVHALLSFGYKNSDNYIITYSTYKQQFKHHFVSKIHRDRMFLSIDSKFI